MCVSEGMRLRTMTPTTTEARLQLFECARCGLGVSLPKAFLHSGLGPQPGRAGFPRGCRWIRRHLHAPLQRFWGARVAWAWFRRPGDVSPSTGIMIADVLNGLGSILKAPEAGYALRGLRHLLQSVPSTASGAGYHWDACPGRVTGSAWDDWAPGTWHGFRLGPVFF